MDLFKIGRKDAEPVIHGIRIKVRGGSQPLPPPLLGAFVTAFSVATEPREAVITSVRALQAMGYDFEDILPEGLSMPLKDWGAYISSAWPEFRDEFPPQSQIAERLSAGGVVFSPFAGYDR
ncbi:MAG: hypothetical protein Q8J89_08360 [Caulobacter sp.]|nr:hypothetical protein [Caulobacter sp.]